MSYELRKRLVDIARKNKGLTETSKNQAPWIKELWTATSYGVEGHDKREPYCAAGMCWTLREWLKDPEVLKSLNLDAKAAEKWRCKSASVYKAPRDNWLYWAGKIGAKILGPNDTIHTGDFVIYKRSHIDLAVDDTNVYPNFYSIGYNTSSGGFSRDGEGCFEKLSSRKDVLNFIRVLD